MNNCTQGCTEQQICTYCQEFEMVWLGSDADEDGEE